MLIVSDKWHFVKDSVWKETAKAGRWDGSMVKEIVIKIEKEKIEDILYLTDDLALLRALTEKGKKAAAVLTKENRNEDFSGILYALEQIEELDQNDYEKIYKRLAGIPWGILETKRCRLREMTEEDLDALYEIYAEESITRYMENLYEDREEERKYIADYRKYVYGFYEYGMWIVEEKETGRIIGRAGVDPHGEEMELGYVIGVPWQRQGYAGEVCQAILLYMWKEIEGCQEIISRVLPENTASVKLLQKLGFEKAGKREEMEVYRIRKAETASS